jgi:hypothetical protein
LTLTGVSYVRVEMAVAATCYARPCLTLSGPSGAAVISGGAVIAAIDIGTRTPTPSASAVAHLISRWAPSAVLVETATPDASSLDRVRTICAAAHAAKIGCLVGGLAPDIANLISARAFRVGGQDATALLIGRAISGPTSDTRGLDALLAARVRALDAADAFLRGAPAAGADAVDLRFIGSDPAVLTAVVSWFRSESGSRVILGSLSSGSVMPAAVAQMTGVARGLDVPLAIWDARSSGTALFGKDGTPTEAGRAFSLAAGS